MSDKEKVLDAMKNAGKPMNTSGVAEASGLDKEVVAKAMAELKKEAKIVSPKKCFWEPAK